MSIRAIAFFTILSLAGASFAQEPAPATESVPDSRLAAARELAQTMLIDSDLFEQAIESLSAETLPRMRARTNEMRVSPRARTAAAAFLDTMPAMITEEINLVLPQAVDEAALEIREIFSEAELREITIFMRDPLTQQFMVRTMLSGGAINPTEAELQRVLAFAETPAGAAYAARGGDMNAAFQRALSNAGTRIEPRIMRRTMEGLCAALANECPAEIRALLAPV